MDDECEASKGKGETRAGISLFLSENTKGAAGIIVPAQRRAEEF